MVVINIEDDNSVDVSVIVITYNQSKYIRQALDSILMQKVNFKYEILVGDDASTDGTQEILQEYADKYPGLFKLVLRNENVGATKNAYDILIKASGNYLATLEGDDYWTDENKLQIQYDFMEHNQEFVGCTHKFKIVDENNIPYKKQKLNWVKQKKIFSLDDFQGLYLPGQPSTFFRRNLFLSSNYDFSALYKLHPLIGDRTLMLYFLLQGDFYCINKKLSAYRKVGLKTGKNITALVYRGNPCLDEYNFTCNLEEYALKEFNKKINLKQRKRDIFSTSIIKIIKNPSKDNIYIGWKILELSEDYIGNISNLPIYILKKFIKRVIYR